MPTILANSSSYGPQRILNTTPIPDSFVPFAHPSMDGTPLTTSSLYPASSLVPSSTLPQTKVPYPILHSLAVHATSIYYLKTTSLTLLLTFLL